MLVFLLIPSIYDFLTFAVMLGIFHASQPLFRTGWFVESLATQVLVIFIIRTNGRPCGTGHSCAPIARAATLLVAALVAAGTHIRRGRIDWRIFYWMAPPSIAAFIARATWLSVSNEGRSAALGIA